jgi:hypothetical protein
MVVILTSKVVGNATFIHLKIPTQLAKTIEEEDA